MFSENINISLEGSIIIYQFMESSSSLIQILSQMQKCS